MQQRREKLVQKILRQKLLKKVLQENEKNFEGKNFEKLKWNFYLRILFNRENLYILILYIDFY